VVSGPYQLTASKRDAPNPLAFLPPRPQNCAVSLPRQNPITDLDIFNGHVATVGPDHRARDKTVILPKAGVQLLRVFGVGHGCLKLRDEVRARTTEYAQAGLHHPVFPARVRKVFPDPTPPSLAVFYRPYGRDATIPPHLNRVFANALFNVLRREGVRVVKRQGFQAKRPLALWLIRVRRPRQFEARTQLKEVLRL
jgi:hypothetical protein